MMWWGDGWNGWMGWGWLFGGLIMIGVVLVVVALVALLARPREGGAPPSAADRTAGPSAQQILDDRYARGEIDTDEYQERSKGLGRS